MRRESLPVAELMDLILEESGYREMLHDGSPEAEERWENVLELRSVAADYPDMTLTEFLEQVSLVSDADTLPEGGSAPTLLTLHAAKGLEFSIVFIVGLEDEMLPHKRSWDDPDQMAEERRLLYVGITRAKDELYLLHCFRRSNWGNVDYGRPSRFLNDIPDELVSGRAVRTEQPAPSRTDWSWSSAAGSRRDLPKPAWESARESSPAPAVAAPTYSTGQQVRHPKFGDGVVVESKLADGDSIVTIAFKDVGLKRLLGSLAKLEVIEEPA
jgi:DNA helicase-2/ATP-dependent DNA helicase PcrA